MFNGHNLYTILSPIFYVTKIFGLSPFQINSECYQKSKINVLWSMVFMLSNFIYVMVYLDGRSIMGTSVLTKVPAVINSYLSPLSMFFYILFGFIHSNKILKVIQDLNSFDQNMEIFLLLNLKKEYKKSKIYLILGILAHIIHISLSIFFTSLISTLDYFLESVLLYIIPTMCNAFVGMQCCALILCIKQRFTWLNRRVDGVSKTLENNFQECGKMKNGKRIEKPIPSLNIGPVLEKVRVQHHLLCLISNNINKAYSVQILLMVLKNFVTIITGLFYLGRYLMIAVQVDAVYLTYCCIQLSLAVAQLLLLSIVCSCTSSEAQKTGSVIHNTMSFSNKRKEELKKLVSYFSLQLLHQRVEFTACKIFVVNEGLLLTIVGAVSTYLVIVIQFQLQDNNKQLKLENDTVV